MTHRPGKALRWATLCILLLVISGYRATAVSILTTGDVAVVGLNTVGDDDFSFVALVDLDASVVLTLSEGDGDSLTYRAPAGGVPRGTVVAIQSPKSLTPTATLGTVDPKIAGWDWGLNSDSDELEIYQSGNPIYATDTSGYSPPAPLSAAQFTHMPHPIGQDASGYNGTRTGTRGEMLAAIGNGANWDYQPLGAYDLDASPYIDAMTVTNGGGGGGPTNETDWIGTVVDGYIWQQGHGLDAGTPLTTAGIVGDVQTDNDDATTAATCFARPGETLGVISGPGGRTVFSVYFTSDFPGGVVASTLELNVHHKGQSAQSGTLLVLVSTNRFDTQWYLGGTGSPHFTSPDISWNDTEQETTIDLLSVLTSVDNINSCEIVLMNRATSSGNVYFDYVELTADTENFGAPLINNTTGADNITASSAILRGEVEAGGPAPNVTVFWGDEPGGTSGPWDTSEDLGAVSVGSFGRAVTGLVANKTYYYRAYATNEHGEAWAETNASFTALGPEINFDLAASGTGESDVDLDLLVTLSDPSILPVTISYATIGGTAASGNDYNLTAGNLVFPPGQTQSNIAVTILSDDLDEDAETLTVGLSAPINGTLGSVSNHTVTITDDDPLPSLQFTGQPFSATENAGPALATVSLSQESGRDLSVDYETLADTALAGSDYTTTTGRLTWTAGETAPKNISIPLVNNSEPENPESFDVRLQNPVNATLTGTNPESVTINDDDLGPPVVNNASGANPVSSNSATLHGNITSTGGAETRAWMYWGTSNAGTNTGTWQHCIPLGTNAIGPIQSSIAGLSPNTTHYYRCLASNGFGRAWSDATTNFLTGPATVQFATAASSESENIGAMEISVQLSNPSVYGEPVAITIGVTGGVAIEGTDFTFSDTNIVIPAGVSSTSIYVNVTEDNLDEFSEALILNISAADKAFIGPTANHVASIDDNDAQPDLEFSNTPYSVGEADSQVTIPVTLNDESGKNISVNFATAAGSATPGSDYVHIAGPLFWAAGETGTKTFDVQILNNEISSGNRFFEVRLSAPVNVTISGNTEENVTIIEDDASGAQVSNADGVSAIRSAQAQLNGEVIAGVPAPDAFIYWGPDNGGTDPSAWSNCVPMGAQSGPFSREVIGLSAATEYFYRCYATNAAGTDWADETASFTTTAAQAYYVNDSVLVNDIYCEVVGNDSNDGLSPISPKATVGAILSTHDLEPGDTVYIDTGNYISSTITITAADAGNIDSNILFRGSTHADATLIDRNSIGSDLILVDVDGAAYVTFQHLRLTGGKYGFRAVGTAGNLCTGAEIIDCDVFGNSASAEGGIYLQQCQDALVMNCLSHNNGWSGIGLHTCTDAVISSNTCYDNTYYGVYVTFSTDPLISYNTCYDHTGAFGFGILTGFGSGERVEYNTLYGNGDEGIRIDGDDGTASYNISRSNSGVGIKLTGSDFKMIGNRVHWNGSHGIESEGNEGLRCENNLVYSNDAWNVRFTANNNRIIFRNNTIHGGNGVYFHDPDRVTNRYNIIWAEGSGKIGLEVPNIPPGPTDLESDYNNFYATDSANVGKWGATLCTDIANWQGVVWKDPNSLGVDPDFVDPFASCDYHLQSTAASYHNGLWTPDPTDSPCIDAADLQAAFDREPDYNGLVRNFGAYGNTPQASQTFYDGELFSVSLTAVPSEAGSVSISPNGTLFPTNRQVTIVATLDDLNYGWQGWTGTTTFVAMSNSFYVTTNLFLQALFAPLLSNTNGVPDWWLTLHNIPVSQEGAEADTDLDGHLNWQEFDAGTVPTNPLSVLHLIEVTPGSPRDAVTFLSVSGKLYRLQASTDLVAPGWTYRDVSLTPAGALSSAPFEGVEGSMTIYLVPPGTTPAYRIELQ